MQAQYLVALGLLKLPLSFWSLGFCFGFGAMGEGASSVQLKEEEPVTIRVSARFMPVPGAVDMVSLINREILLRFEELHPHIRVLPANRMVIDTKGEIITLMQIAADIAPDILAINFRGSDSFIQQEFLYPLDEYLARMSSEEFQSRFPPHYKPVVERMGSDGQKHFWVMPPSRTAYMAMHYRKDAFRASGLDPDQPPRDWVELERCLEKIRLSSSPDRPRYGMAVSNGDGESWSIMSFMLSAGTEIVKEDAPNQWRAAFNSAGAVEALAYYYGLVKKGLVYRGADADALWLRGDSAITFGYIYDTQIYHEDPAHYGIAPIPLSPQGRRVSEFNGNMMGIYSGIKDPRVREAAWEFIRFYTSMEAQKIGVKFQVQNNLACTLNPHLLEKHGYLHLIPEVNKTWSNTLATCMANARPEAYGRNCNLIHMELSRPLDQMFHDLEVSKAWEGGDQVGFRERLKVILDHAVLQTNQRLLDAVPSGELKFRSRVALGAVLVVAAVLLWTFRMGWKSFIPPTPTGVRVGWQFKRYGIAYIFLIPALASIFIWQYIPLFRGSLMAFQRVRIMGDSQWVGLENIAMVLFDQNFWHSLWVTLQYVFWSLSLGFFAPVILAILLHEIPRGKTLFRVIFYLPTLVSGLVVVFLWKSFYAKTGLLNTIFDWLGYPTDIAWLSDPRFVLVACVLPTVWAAIGPGSLLYLAALKNIPEALYEASDLDGAGFIHKIIHIVIPNLKNLLVINLVGAFAGTFHSSQFIFAMTGGGPYVPYGETEVTSLLVFYNAFMYLKMGVATAMAWTLSAMLLGFTLLQLKRLARMEFKAVEGD